VFDLLGYSDWLKVKFAWFSYFLMSLKERFPLHLRKLIDLLFIFAFVERVDWVVICLFIDLIFVFSSA
jgi:hypothetical protein